MKSNMNHFLLLVLILITIILLFLSTSCEFFAPSEIRTNIVFFEEEVRYANPTCPAAIFCASEDEPCTTIRECKYGCMGSDFPLNDELPCYPNPDIAPEYVSISENVGYYIFIVFPADDDDRRFYYRRNDGRVIHRMLRKLSFTIATDNYSDSTLTKNYAVYQQDLDMNMKMDGLQTDCLLAPCVAEVDEQDNRPQQRPTYPTIASWDGKSNDCQAILSALGITWVSEDNWQPYVDGCKNLMPDGSVPSELTGVTIPEDYFYFYQSCSKEQLLSADLTCLSEYSGGGSTISMDAFIDAVYYQSYRASEFAESEPLNDLDLPVSGDSVNKTMAVNPSLRTLDSLVTDSGIVETPLSPCSGSYDIQIEFSRILVESSLTDIELDQSFTVLDTCLSIQCEEKRSILYIDYDNDSETRIAITLREVQYIDNEEELSGCSASSPGPYSQNRYALGETTVTVEYE